MRFLPRARLTIAVFAIISALFATTAHGASYDVTILNDNPTGYWRLGEQPGETEAGDESDNAYVGAYQDVQLGEPGGLDYDGDAAPNFTVANSSMVVNDSPGLNFGTQDFTVEAWVKTTTANYSNIVSKAPGSFLRVGCNHQPGDHGVMWPGWGVSVSSKVGFVGRVEAIISDSGMIDEQNCAVPNGVIAFSSQVVNDGAWHHVVAVFSRLFGVTVYVDAVGTMTPGGSPASLTSTAPVSIGLPPVMSGFNTFSGHLDEVAIYPYALSAAQVTAHYAARTARVEDTDEVGPLEPDRTPATVDVSNPNPAAPIPQSPSGPPPPGSYTTELWDEEATGAVDGERVVSSTNLGTFALTGLVLDEVTGLPIVGATVQVDSTPIGGPTTSVITTTDSAGAYAFIHIPSSSNTRFLITQLGYGSYEEVNHDYAADETYQKTTTLTSQGQYFDASAHFAPNRLLGGTFLPNYTSHTRIPPFITVGVHGTVNGQGQVVPSCGASAPFQFKRTYSYKYYVLRTIYGEIRGSSWPRFLDNPPRYVRGPFMGAAWRAVGSAISNYGWFHRIYDRDPEPGRDIENTVDYQCFLPAKTVPRWWWFAVNEVLDERVAGPRSADLPTFPRGRLINTYHLGEVNPDACLVDIINQCPNYHRVQCGAPGTFTDTTFDPDGFLSYLNTLSQMGAKKAHEECQVTNWRKIVNYYYTRGRIDYSSDPSAWRVGTVKKIKAPPNPTITCDNSKPSQIKFTFISKQGVSEVGWVYVLQRKDPSGGPWETVKARGFNQNAQAIIHFYEYPRSPTSYKWRVYATNPGHKSPPTRYNGGQPITPTSSDDCS